jgi:hypothetical protein
MGEWMFIFMVIKSTILCNMTPFCLVHTRINILVVRTSNTIIERGDGQLSDIRVSAMIGFLQIANYPDPGSQSNVCHSCFIFRRSLIHISAWTLAVPVVFIIPSKYISEQCRIKVRLPFPSTSFSIKFSPLYRPWRPLGLQEVEVPTF